MSSYFPMPEGYRCPLCPNHDDEEFCWEPLLSSPICRACSHDIINLVCDEQRIDDSALSQLEEVTGLNFAELQVAILSPEIRQKVESLESPDAAAKRYGISPEHLDEWLESQREDLARFRRLVAIAKAKLRTQKVR